MTTTRIGPIICCREVLSIPDVELASVHLATVMCFSYIRLTKPLERIIVIQ
jgi:hypothetical protein